VATKKNTGKKLADLIGKQVKVQQSYKDVPEGPYTLMGIDYPFVFLGINGHTVGCNMNRMDVIAVYPGEVNAE